HPPSESPRSPAHRSERRICTARDLFVTANVFIRPFNDDRAKQESQIKRIFVIASCEALIRLPGRGGIAFGRGSGLTRSAVQQRAAKCGVVSHMFRAHRSI